MIDATDDLSADAPFVRARRGRVDIELARIGADTSVACAMLGMSDDVVRKIPFPILPFVRKGRHRWYLVQQLHTFADRLMALRMMRGEPATTESILHLIASLPPMEAPFHVG